MNATRFPGPILERSLVDLENAVNMLTKNLPKPLYLGEPPRGNFRYADRDDQLFQVLKAVRVVSGLHAAVHLSEVRHYQEAAVVLRTVSEALQDIDVVNEGRTSSSGPTEYQKDLVDQFFACDDVDRVPAILAGTAEATPRVPRKKKRAAVERYLSRRPNTDPLRNMLDAVDAILDGYVHCGYAQVMEMYFESATSRGFMMRGIEVAARADLFARWFPLFVYHALNSIAGLLYGARANEHAETLLQLRNELEASHEYPK